MRLDIPPIKTRKDFKTAIRKIEELVQEKYDEQHHYGSLHYTEYRSCYVDIIEEFDRKTKRSSINLDDLKKPLEGLNDLISKNFEPALIRSIEWSYKCSMKFVEGRCSDQDRMIKRSLVDWEIHAYQALIRDTKAILSEQSVFNLVVFRIKTLSQMKSRLESNYYSPDKNFNSINVRLLEIVLGGLITFAMDHPSLVQTIKNEVRNARCNAVTKELTKFDFFPPPAVLIKQPIAEYESAPEWPEIKEYNNEYKKAECSMM